MSKPYILYKGLFPSKPTFTEVDYPDLQGKVYFVTGATGGIGLATAKHLAIQGAKVYLHGRSASKLDAGIAEIKAQVPNAQLIPILFDMADLETIKPGIAPVLKEPKLDGIVLNAGVAMPETTQKTKQGYNMQLGVNNIAHHLVMRFLNQVVLKQSSECRVVWVASVGHVFSPPTGVNWDTETNSPKAIDDMDDTDLYGQSKAINIIQSYRWPRQNNAGSNILSVATHPGIYMTDIYKYSDWITTVTSRWLSFPDEYRSYTEMYALLSPDIANAESPIYVSPYGQLIPGVIRTDVLESTKGKVGEDVWRYLDDQTDKYV